MGNPISIALATDDNYIDGLVGTLAGAAYCSSGVLKAIILDCGIRHENWGRLEQTFEDKFPNLSLRRLQVSSDQLQVFNLNKKARRLSDTAYARILLPELLPELDRIIYLDCDLHIDADLQTLFDTPMEGKALAAVPESHAPDFREIVTPEAYSPQMDTLSVFNSGVLLLNLSVLRRIDLTQRILMGKDCYDDKFQDQALLNYAFQGEWKPLSPRWNRQRFVTENFSIYRNHPDSIWHFIGKMKPWHFSPQHARGLMADFQRNTRAVGWIPQHQGTWKPNSPVWRDALKAFSALVSRQYHRTSQDE